MSRYEPIAGPRCPDCGEGHSEHRVGCKVLEREVEQREAARQEQLKRIKTRQTIAAVRGHLEGYADGMDRTLTLGDAAHFVAHKQDFIDSLREDAASLASVLEPEEQPDDQLEEGAS